GNNDFEDAVNKAKTSFEAAMDDDFNAPKALAAYFDFIKDINKSAESVDKDQILKAKKLFDDIGNVFGILVEEKEEDLEEKLIQFIIDLREDARKKKDFETSDKIRAKLKEIGIILEDGEKTTWKKSL
ncbi:MAG: cysteine--tRNA ligase, partial [Methanomicrobia archaeon]|nr:cysteine--tRNA ligase [Methanomicrobia archaeon]